MFIEVHDEDGHPVLICVDDIQRVSRSSEGGSEIYLNEHEDAIEVRDTVSAVRDLIIRAGGIVAASAKVETGAIPIKFHTVDGNKPKD
jgi:hypothetical protein